MVDVNEQTREELSKEARKRTLERTIATLETKMSKIHFIDGDGVVLDDSMVRVGVVRVAI